MGNVQQQLGTRQQQPEASKLYQVTWSILLDRRVQNMVMEISVMDTRYDNLYWVRINWEHLQRYYEDSNPNEFMKFISPCQTYISST